MVIAFNPDEADRPDASRPDSGVGEPSIWLAAIVAGSNFMAGVDQNIVVTALPAIGRSLNEPATVLGLTMTAYVAALIIALPLGGWVAERFGPRRAYAFAALLFTMASVLCGLADTFWQLIAARMLQGFGGALMGTVGQIVILSAFPRHRTLKINVYTSLASQVAPMVGPILGGVLTTYLSWRWAFFINLPIGLLVAASALRLFPTEIGNKARPLDVAGFILLGLGTTLLVFGLNGIADSGLPAWLVAVQLIAAVALLAFAIRHGLRAAHPLLDLRLLRIRTFRISLLNGGALDTLGLTAVIFILPLMLQIGFGLSAAEAGSLTFFAGVGTVSARLLLPTLLRFLGFRRLLLINTPIVAASVAAFALLEPSTPAWVTAGLIVLFGMLRSWQWGTTANLAYVDIPSASLPGFSVMYYILWQLVVALSIGFSSVMLAVLAEAGAHPTIADFHIAFGVAALVTLCALTAYLQLKPDDGRQVSGHIAGRPGQDF